MLIGITLIIIAWIIVLVAEVCKSNGLYRGMSIFRVFTMLYVLTAIVYGFSNQTGFLGIFGIELNKCLPILSLAGIYSFIMFILELYLPRKYYPTYLDVPRQVLYKVGKYGKCIVLSEKEAKQAHKNGETVYIHAMARVTYKPKDETEKEQPKGVDMGKGLDAAGYALHDQQRKTIESLIANHPNKDAIKELLNKLQEQRKTGGK